MSMKDLGAKSVITPQAVLLIATYDENGKEDVMNAAWGGQCGPNHIAFNLGSHQTTLNLDAKQAFTVSFADKDNYVAADYVGIVSAKDEPEKMKKAGFTFTKSRVVDAPVINEMKLTIECKVVDRQELLGEIRYVGEIVNAKADESILDENDKVDFGKLQPIIFDSESLGYRVIGERIGNAFKDGAQLK